MSQPRENKNSFTAPAGVLGVEFLIHPLVAIRAAGATFRKSVAYLTIPERFASTGFLNRR